jgi:hypothetical protein
MVGAAGIEPATSCVSSKRSPTELSARVQLHLFPPPSRSLSSEIRPFFTDRAVRCQRSALPLSYAPFASGSVDSRDVAKLQVTGKRIPATQPNSRSEGADLFSKALEEHGGGETPAL